MSEVGDQRTSVPVYRPYDNVHPASFYELGPKIRILCLETYEVHYVTQSAGYTSPHYSDHRVWTVSELLEAGFVEIPWNGRGSFAVLDAQDIAVLVMVGKPADLSPAKSLRWDEQAKRYALKVESLRSRDERPFQGKAGHHSRGDFGTVTFGIGYGGGRKKPSNTSSRTVAEKSIVNELLEDADLNEFAARGSDAVELFFPLAHEHLCNKMRELHQHHPHLRFAFKDSAYPACTMNLGPRSVSFMHGDGGDYPGLPGSIHAFGSFDPAKGGHIVPFDLKLFIRFPAGTLSLLSSSGFRHGNTPIQDGETRYSFTQYTSGHLMKWVAHGCRPAGSLSDEEKIACDAAALEGWENQKARLSKFFELEGDRQDVYARRRGRRYQAQAV